MTVLKGIDVSSYQAGLDVGGILADFVIIKATGGNGYVNPHCDGHYQQAKASGKKRGVYHYYSDGYGGDNPEQEADYFVDNCAGYIGDAILVLDWERGGNPHVNDVSFAKRWLDHVYARTGVRPLIYMSLSLIQGLDWSSVIAGGYGLFCADYVSNATPIPKYAMATSLDPNPTWDGNVNDVLWQFTSSGRLDGYGGNLDCDFFFGDGSAWDAYARSDHQSPAPEPQPEPLPAPVPAPEPQPEPAPAPEPAPEPTPDPTPEPIPAPVEPPVVIPPIIIPDPVVIPPKPTPQPVVSPQNLIWVILAAIAGLLIWFFK